MSATASGGHERGVEARRRGPRVPARLLRLASDERLVDALRGGSEAAFEVIYTRHHRGVLSFCRHMLGSVEEAEDAVQHTFLAAYRDLLRSDKPIHLRPWLYAIARNRCLSVLRARRERSLDAPIEPSTEHLVARGRAPARPARPAGRPRGARARPARGARARRAGRHVARRDRRRARVPEGEGEGARVPGAELPDRQPDGARHLVRGDPRAAREPARRLAAPQHAAPPSARVPRLPRLPRPGARAARRAGADPARRPDVGPQGGGAGRRGRHGGRRRVSFDRGHRDRRRMRGWRGNGGRRHRPRRRRDAAGGSGAPARAGGAGGRSSGDDRDGRAAGRAEDAPRHGTGGSRPARGQAAPRQA